MSSSLCSSRHVTPTFHLPKHGRHTVQPPLTPRSIYTDAFDPCHPNHLPENSFSPRSMPPHVPEQTALASCREQVAPSTDTWEMQSLQGSSDERNKSLHTQAASSPVSSQTFPTLRNCLRMVKKQSRGDFQFRQKTRVSRITTHPHNHFPNLPSPATTS